VDGRLEYRRALAALVTGACVIGLAPILVRFADVGPAAAGGWRLAFALPLLAPLAMRTATGIGGPPPLAILAGTAFALDLGFWHYGIANTTVAKATVLTNLTPVVVTAFVWALDGERPTRRFLVAVALAVGGAWIMAAARGDGRIGPNPLLGDALSVATAFWYALYFLAMSAARRATAATRVMFWSTATGMPLLLLSAWLLNETLVPAAGGGWAVCAALGVVHVAGQGLIAWALGRLPAPTAAVTVLVQPVVAAALGWVLLGERLGVWQFVGATIALSGVLLAQRHVRA
jgi:drug/metabolite transporter (DMT)-like permease